MKRKRLVFKRILKIAVICLCLSGFLMQTVQFLFLYWTYPIVVDIQEYLPMEIDLPAISFCNSNGLRPNTFCAFQGHCYPPFIMQYLKVCGIFPRLCLYKDKPPREMTVVAYNSFIQKYDINVSTMHAMKMPVNDFLKCKIVRGSDEVNCSMDDLVTGSYYSDTGMFNLCYTINSLWGNPEKKIDKIRKFDKIVLDFFLDLSLRGPSESVDAVKSPKFNLPNADAAVQLAVHSPYVTVNPSVSGVVLLGGRNYQVKLKMEDKHLLPPPYQTNCTDYMTTWLSRGGRGPLNQLMAVEECKVNKSLERLGCVPFVVDYPHNETVCKYCPNCPEISEIQIECSELLHVYNQPCDFSTYKLKAVEQTVFVERILENLETRENESLVFAQKEYNCSTERIWTQRCQQLSIEILFDDFLITNLTYNPKIESLQLFSVIGGYMGMYLGVSFVTGFDVADGLLKALFLILKKKQRERGKRSRNKVFAERVKGEYAADGSLRRRPGHSERRYYW